MLLGIPIIGDFLTKSIHVCRTHLYDMFDRLHFMLTAYVLAFFVILIGAKQHFGNPIDCMLQKEVDDISSWRNYIHSYCLIHGTYRYTFNSSSFNLPGHGSETSVPYYQWVPFFLAFQIFCFIFPHWVWTWMQKLFYLDMAMVVAITKELLNEKKKDEHKSKLSKTIGYTYDHFKYRRLHKIGYFSWCFMHPAFSCILYIFTKLMFLGNAILQLKFVSMFLGFESWTWGFEMTSSLIFPHNNAFRNGSDVFSDARPNLEQLSYNDFNHFKNFPILVACDYHTIPTLAFMMNSTAQCIIPLNIVNEKIFVGLWIWFVVLIALTVIGTVRWIVRLTDRSGIQKMVHKLLKPSEKQRLTNSLNIVKKNDHIFDFINQFLGADGILMIYFMIDKCGVIQTQEVINGLFVRFSEDHVKPTIPIIMAKKGEKTDYSEVNFGSNFDEDDMYERSCV